MLDGDFLHFFHSFLFFVFFVVSARAFAKKKNTSMCVFCVCITKVCSIVFVRL